jgi:hypothetical protein
MIGIDSIGFLILLVISIVVSGVLHYGLNYYVTPGFYLFCSKVVVGWMGMARLACLGLLAPPVPVSTAILGFVAKMARSAR